MKDNLKIQFAGSQGTGKTTLFEEAKKDPDFKEFLFSNEKVRDLLKKKKVTINEEGDWKSQKLIFDEYMKVLDQKKSLISDRCIIDVVSYTLWILSFKEMSEEEKQFTRIETERQLSILKERKNDLGTVIYFPIEFNVVGDGIRSMKKEFQKEIDLIIRSTLQLNSIPYQTISGSVEQRLKQLKEIIFSHIQMLQRNEKM